MMENNTVVLEQVVQRTTRIRSQKASSTGPASIYEVSFDTQSKYFGDAGSTIAPTEFGFDDALVNSRAYRRALAVAMGRSKEDDSQQPSGMNEASSAEASQTIGAHSSVLRK